MLKPSQFNVVTTHPQTGAFLVFNTSTGALAAVEGADREAAAHLLATGSAEADDGLVADLAGQGFLVDEGADEVGPVLERIGLGIEDNNRLDVFLLPNMHCNFACPYCFENHRPSQMSDEIERRILAWFERVAPRFKVVLVSWFGGEPMLSYPQIVRMQHTIKSICSRSGVKFNSHITTNGYQLTAARADALCAAGLLSYQITVDGPPEVHNCSRVLKGGGESFPRVFGNLIDLARDHPEANIKLRVNFTPDTLVKVPELLVMVPTEVRSRLHLVLERIFGQGLLETWSLDDVARATERTYDLARELGFTVTSTPLGPGSLTYCYADRKNQVLFTHTGDVFKCTVSKFNPEDRLGYLGEDGQINWDGGRYDDWMGMPAVDDECSRCTYMPMCLGGCRKNREQLGHASADCTLPFVALDLRVQQQYSRLLGLEPEPFVVAGPRRTLPIIATS